jgi:hypothetical protein
MKTNNTKIKIKTKEFDPIKHWFYLLCGILMLFILIIFYSVYTFFYIKSQIDGIQIDSKNNVQNSTSTDSTGQTMEDNGFMTDINNLNKTLGVFSDKEVQYQKMIGMVEIPVVISTTTLPTSTVATSSNR